MRQISTLLPAILFIISTNTIAQVNTLTNGNIGIGATTALDGARLTIKGDVGTSWKLLALDGNTDDWFLGSFGGGGFFIAKDNFASTSSKFSIVGDNVGIGTSTPGFKFVVKGNNGINQYVIGNSGNGENIETLKGNILLMRNTNTAAYNAGSSLAFGTGVSPEYVWAAVEGLYTGYTAGNHGGDLRFLTKKNNTANLAERMRINKNGNVGIGTSTPGFKFVVKGNNGINQYVLGNSGNGENIETLKGNILLMRNTNTAAYNAGSSLAFGTGVSSEYVWAAIEGLYTGYTAGNHGGDLRFLTKKNNTANLSERMRITKNGNVGIGKLTPTAKLHVDGNIISEEVKVEDVTPADFVFDPDYNLPTLEATEAYIKAHKHLPEIPSAAEMEANGLELGKMNMLLLQKIEELTLHMIEQDKLIQQVIQYNGDLKDELLNLKNNKK